MDTFGVDFDEVADKPVIAIRNAARDYVPAFEMALSCAREKLKKGMTARDALESMRSNLDALCSSIRYVCQKMEDPIPETGMTIVALNAHASVQAEGNKRRKCDLGKS